MRTILAAVVLLTPVAFAWWWSARGGGRVVGERQGNTRQGDAVKRIPRTAADDFWTICFALLISFFIGFAAADGQSGATVYVACSVQATPSTSRCPPGDDRVVLARTETGWTVARYYPDSGWLTPNGVSIRVRIVDWADLPSVEVPK